MGRQVLISKSTKHNRYYELTYAKKILKTNPIICDTSKSYEVHILTCERDKLMVLWALKTFFFYLGEVPALVIHDDGSLSEKTLRLLKNHFVGCRIIREKSVLGDMEFRRKIKKHPLCALWRFECFAPLSRKILDIGHFSNASYIVILDSDLLFFKRPKEIVNYIKRQTPFMSTDFAFAYAISKEFTESKGLGYKIHPYLNSGLLGLPKSLFDLGAVEDFLQYMINISPLRRFPFEHPHLEQTIIAALFSKNGFNQVLDIRKYQISTMLLEKNTVAHHFTSDMSRPCFFHWGLRHLERLEFLEHI